MSENRTASATNSFFITAWPIDREVKWQKRMPGGGGGGENAIWYKHHLGPTQEREKQAPEIPKTGTTT